jgi:DNA-3-methyladenine glycosylase
MKLPELNWREAKTLSLEFFQRDARRVAPELLGKALYLKQNNKEFLVEVSEVEAYLGKEDPASHAYRGLTKRNWPMFEVGGMCYVYLSYGVHYCMNVVTGRKGDSSAILIRGGVALSGVDPQIRLNGPGKLTRGLGINLNFNGALFNQENFRMMDLGKVFPKTTIGTSPRIGISRAIELPYRYYVIGSPGVSK